MVKYPLWTPERNKKLKSLYNTDKTIQEIAKALECSVDAVYNQAERLNLRRKEKTSKYHGVSWFAAKQRWRVSVYTKKTGRVIVGTFRDEKEAAKAYDQYIKKMKLDRTLNF